MPEIIFQRLKSTATGESASTGKQTEVAFNDNFALVKTLLDQLFAIASVAVTSEQITQLKADTTTNPYTLYYTTDTTEPVTWNRLMNVGFSDLSGDPMDNIALKTILDAKGSAYDVSTLQTQMTAAQGNISNLQTTVGQHTTTIGQQGVAITGLQSDVNDRVRTPHGDTLYLQYDEVNGSVQYSTNGTTWVDILSSGITFASITGNASDNTSLVTYVADQIANTMVTIANTYATQAQLTNHTTDLNNPHGVTKAQIGLGNVDNTSDANKPISNATQAAINAITANTPPIYNILPADYRSGTVEPNAVYFTSNSFVIND